MFDLFAALVLWYQHLNRRLAARVDDSYGMYYIRRIRNSYLPRLVRAHRYSYTRAKHKYDRRDKQQVTARTPQAQRTYGRINVQSLPPVQNLRWENTDAVIADPAWAAELQERLRAAHFTISKGPNNDKDTSHVGRNPDADGTNDSPAQSVHSREGWGNHRGHPGQDRRGGLQRATERVSARTATLLDLVHPDDFAFPVPQLRRLPQPAC